MDKFFLKAEEAGLIIIDIQDKLAASMKHKDQVVTNGLHLIETAKLLQMPVLLTEQYPKGLGPTLAEIKAAMPVYEPFEKLSFDCCQESGFLEKVASMGRKKWLIIGMEAHICVLQTSLGMMQAGHTVQIVQDAICSRSKSNFKTGVTFMDRAGAVLTCTEIVLFQLLRKAGSEVFRTISKRIK